jgi:hypothetical protein
MAMSVVKGMAVNQGRRAGSQAGLFLSIGPADA